MANADPIELVLADGIMKATAAEQWDIVAQLARELEARRSARVASRSATVTPIRGGRRTQR